MKMDDAMKQLFERAEQEGLWFYCRYQQLWFSPAELKRAQRKGQFRFSAVNWELRNPDAYIQERLREVHKATNAYEVAVARVGKEVKHEQNQNNPNSAS